MNEQDGHKTPIPTLFDSTFGNFMEPLATPTGNSGSHGLASSLWPFFTSQNTTHYDEISQYLAEGGCASVAGMQAVTGASDFQGNLYAGTGSTDMDSFWGSSFQTGLWDANMLDDCQYQDLLRRIKLSYFGQCENMKNESQTTHSVRDLGQTTAVSLLENYALAQNHTSRTEEVNGNSVHVIQSHLKPSKAKRFGKRSREELNACDAKRRLRVINGIQDLEKLLPQSAKNQHEVVDKSIEYVKHLQLQLKELSQNILGSEADTDPLITLKGPNIHLPAQVFLKEFKDISGRFLKDHPAAAKKLLESRGLQTVPTALLKVLYHKE